VFLEEGFKCCKELINNYFIYILLEKKAEELYLTVSIPSFNPNLSTSTGLPCPAPLKPLDSMDGREGFLWKSYPMSL
jgi:hypothetical protein